MEKKRGDYVEGDRRNLQQRRCDAFISLLEGFAAAGDGVRTGRDRGLASVVVSVSARDLERLTDNAALPHEEAGKIASAGTSQLMPTNTNACLSALDILRLGLAAYDYGVMLDPFSGRAKAGGRVQRHASVEQKLMLIAEQLGCTHPGCTEPACNSDVHHIVAFVQGGRTDVENLTLLCRRHHRLNRDARDGRGGMGNAVVDPVTKRKCWMDGHVSAGGETSGGMPGSDVPGVVLSGDGASSGSTPGSGVSRSGLPWSSVSDVDTPNSNASSESMPCGGSDPHNKFGLHNKSNPRNKSGPGKRRIRFNHSTRAQSAPGYRVARQPWVNDEIRARAESGQLAELGLDLDLPG